MEAATTAQRAKALQDKAEHHVTVEENLEAEKRTAAQARLAREVELGFQAEQRRRLIEIKRESEKRSGQIRLAQEKVIAKTRRQLTSDRRAKLNTILAEAYKARADLGGAGDAGGGGDATPGPGEYYRPHTSNPRGGYFASSRTQPPPNENPGPGAYEVSPKPGTGSGVVPFLPRGKTDVDWIVLTASKLPGVGQYNVASRPKTSSSIVFPKKGTSNLDLVIRRAATLPGPGEYDLEEATPSRGGIERSLMGLE